MSAELGGEPVIIVSSRDNVPVPRVRTADKLVKVAREHGWQVRPTFALAEVPDRYHANGNLAKAAHSLKSVTVRIERGGIYGFATWLCEDDQAWSFEMAWLGGVRHGATSLLVAVTEDVSGRPASTSAMVDGPAGNIEGGAVRLTGAGPALIPGGAR